MSIVVSLIAGWVLLLGAHLRHPEAEYATDLGATRVPPAEILVDAIGITAPSCCC